MDTTKIQELLKALISGHLSIKEGRERAREAGYPGVFELCEATLPPRLPKIHFLPQRVAKSLKSAREGELPLDELQLWLEEFARITEDFKLGQGVSEGVRVILALAAVAADARIFRDRRSPDAVFEELEAVLRGRAQTDITSLYTRLFQDQEELHFAVRWADPSGPYFMGDLVAHSPPWTGRIEDCEWVAAACLITRGFAAGQGVEGWRTHPAGEELAQSLPDLGLSAVRLDPDGVLELEFARESIGEPEIQAGALFLGELWQVQRVSVNGPGLSLHAEFELGEDQVES